jgi:N-methylhydantoinase B
VLQLVAEYGEEAVRACFESTMARAERRLRQGLARWPDGVAEAEAYLDGDGVVDRPVRIHVRAVKEGDGILFDFSCSDAQTLGPVSVRPQSTETAAFVALLGCVDPTIPLNDGPRRALRFVNPEGRVTHARFPAPVNNYYPTMHLIYSCVQSALARFDPGAAVAPSGLGIGGNSLGYLDGGVQYELMVTSMGGSAGQDGTFVCMAMSQITPSTPVEILETEYPVRVTACAPLCDSAGPGEFRGGVGFVREYQVLGPAKFTLRMGQFRHGAWGVHGGGAPSLAGCVLNPGTDREEALPPLATRDLEPGEVIRFLLPGGGGYGDPLRRDPERVLADVRDGFVSRRAAEEVYGVVLRGDPPELDVAATESLRARSRPPGEGSAPEQGN